MSSEVRREIVLKLCYILLHFSILVVYFGYHGNQTHDQDLICIFDKISAPPSYNNGFYLSGKKYSQHSASFEQYPFWFWPQGQNITLQVK